MENDEFNPVPNVPKWNNDNKIKDLEFLNSVDNIDLDNLNTGLVQCAINLKEINEKLSKWERVQAKCEIEYKRKYRKLMIDSTLNTDSQKRLYAEYNCEDLELKILYAKQIIGELKRMSNNYRTNIEVIQTIGNNIRKEMDL